MRIVGIPGREVRRGDFDATVRNDEVRLPESLARTLLANRITTAERLAEFAFDLPGTLAQLLRWTPDEIEKGRAALVRVLRGHISDELLGPTEPFERGFGALPPRR